MSLELRTCPIWTVSSNNWVYPAGGPSSSFVNSIKNKTGLNISRYSIGTGSYASYMFAINFFGDITPDIGGSSKGGFVPAGVYVGTLTSSITSNLFIAIQPGNATNKIGDVTWYKFDTGISAKATTSNMRQNLGFIHHGNKTLITVVTDSMAASGQFTFAAVMDHARRRIVGIENSGPAGSTPDNIVTTIQSKAFNNDDITRGGTDPYVYEDGPTYTTSSFSVTPPNCSYNVVSLAPLVVPEEASIVEDCFIPVYLRDDTHAQQFDISNGEYTSNYVTSGASSAGTSQYVVRMDSTEIPSNNQTS